jgi:peroxiredoxin Q/BCP
MPLKEFTMLDVGDKAPDFSLPNQDDQTVSLSDFAGKWLVLYFYPKDNTSGCTKEAQDFTALLDAFSQLNAAVVGISRDSTQSHRNFIARHNLRLTLLSDPDAEVHKAYGAWGLKKQYGKVREGVIRSTFIIAPDGAVAALWRNVRVRSKTKKGESRHADKVRVKLEALQGVGNL